MWVWHNNAWGILARVFVCILVCSFCFFLFCFLWLISDEQLLPEEPVAPLVPLSVMNLVVGLLMLIWRNRIVAEDVVVGENVFWLWLLVMLMIVFHLLRLVVEIEVNFLCCLKDGTDVAIRRWRRKGCFWMSVNLIELLDVGRNRIT